MGIQQLSVAWSLAQEVATAALNAGNEVFKLPVDTNAYADALDAAHDQAAAAAERIADTIANIMPTTVDEAATKFRILLERYGDGQGGIDQPAPIFAFLTDLEHLAEIGVRSTKPVTIAA